MHDDDERSRTEHEEDRRSEVEAADDTGLVRQQHVIADTQLEPEDDDDGR